MQAPNYIDPFSVWKSFYTEMEPTISQSMQKWLESDEYAAISGKMLTTTLQMEQIMQTNAEKLLKTYNVPTKNDFARMMELIIGLEAKVDAIEERLVQLEKATGNPAEISEQLTRITEQVEIISANLLGSGSNSRKRAPKSGDQGSE
jgi:polyhydroxyalkanoic acid synthase PhaR subunit